MPTGVFFRVRTEFSFLSLCGKDRLEETQILAYFKQCLIIQLALIVEDEGSVPT